MIPSRTLELKSRLAGLASVLLLGWMGPSEREKIADCFLSSPQ